MISVLEEAYKVGMCNNTMLDGCIDPPARILAEADRNKLSPYRGFWSATLGGAEGLYIDDMLGNFERGKEGDFVALDPNGGQPACLAPVAHRRGRGGRARIEQAANILFGVMILGDDRSVDET